jgi:hypothetical protein
VIRDAAAAKRYSHLVDALTGEFLAARDGIALAAQRGFNRVVLESDNLVLVNMLQSGIADRSVFYGLWEEIQELSRSFASLEFSFVHREGNGAAHVCASLPSLLQPDLAWLDLFPSRLEDATTKDCNPTVI